MKEIPSTKVMAEFGAVTDSVAKGEGPVVVTRHGRPHVVIVAPDYVDRCEGLRIRIESLGLDIAGDEGQEGAA